MRKTATMIVALWLVNFSMPAFADDCVDKLTPESKYREVIECFKAQQKEVAELRQGLAGGVPSGAVLAFDLPTGCPQGWSLFDRGLSRTIIGASMLSTSAVPNLDANQQRLPAHPYQSTGGEERHTLTVSEIPAHNHGVQDVLHDDFQRGGGGYRGTEIVGQAPGDDPKAGIRYSEVTGGGQPHNLLPPFIALFYCRKN